MLRFWIRVNARLARDPEVQSFGIALMPKLPAWHAVRLACGLLLDLWGNVADERESGDLNGVPDGALELWAGWGGKPGRFAAEFRARFIDDTGFIKEWQTYQGKLIERREKDRNRKRGDKSADIPQEVPQEFRNGSSGNPRPNGNGQPPASAPYGAEKQEEAPGALAPVGARTAPRVNGGIPGAPPVADDAERRRYSVRLVELAEDEFTADPDLAFELELEARKHFGLSERKSLKEHESRMVRSEMHERLRVRRGLKSFEEWQGERHAVSA